MPRPMSSQAARKTGRFGALASTLRPSAMTNAEKPRTGRPPWRAMMRPTFGDTNPATSNPADRPPTIHESGQRVSCAIGAARTPSR